MQTKVVLIGGTGAISPAAKLYYHRLAKGCGKAVIQAIPGLTVRRIDTSTREMVKWIDANVPDDTQVILIGHSQGGLVAVECALQRPDKVVHVIALSTPFHGTRTANLIAPFCRHLFLAVRDMSVGSRYMARLSPRLIEVAPRLTTIYLHNDILVQPFDSSHVDGADNWLIASATDFASVSNAHQDTQRLGCVVARIMGHITEVFDPIILRALNKVCSELSPPVTNGPIAA